MLLDLGENVWGGSGGNLARAREEMCCIPANKGS